MKKHVLGITALIVSIVGSSIMLYCSYLTIINGISLKIGFVGLMTGIATLVIELLIGNLMNEEKTKCN